MEAVRKRPQRQKGATKALEMTEKKKTTLHSLERSEEETIIQATSAEMDDIEKPLASEKATSCNEEALTAMRENQELCKEEHVLEIEESDCQSRNDYDGERNTKQSMQQMNDHILDTKETHDQVDISVSVTDKVISAPSAPFLEGSEHLDMHLIPLQPDLSTLSSPAPSPRMQLPIPRAFHEITVTTKTDSAAPSAPLECEDDDDAANQLNTISQVSSLSPVTSKKLHRVAASRGKVEKLSQVMRSRAKLGTDVSVKSSSVAVRRSFAKSHQAEKKAEVPSIYPSMQQEAVKEVTIVADDIAGKVERTYQQLLKNEHIRVKLEPFINYEMNLMRAEASQKRQETKMRHIETNKGELYARVERYLFSEYILHNAASKLDAYKTKVDVLVKKVWTLEKKRVSSAKRCDDNVEIEQQMNYQTAKLETPQLEVLKAHLDKLRQLRTVEASMHTFDRAISYFHVEQYLNSVLLEPSLVMFVNKMSLSCEGASSTGDLDLVPESASFYEDLPQGSSLVSTVDHLKYCLDVLIFFEKKVTLEEEGIFGRVPHSFCRGEIIWHSNHAKMNYSVAGGTGIERKIKCYACGSLNAPMKSNQSCKLCQSCEVVLYFPPSSISTKTNEWSMSVFRFRQSLQKWISACLQCLLRTKSLQIMPYLLMHVMYLPRISTNERSWFLRFLQFPRAMVCADGSLRNAWSEDLVDHYIAMLHLLFHPEKLRQMSVIVSGGFANGTKIAKSANVGVTDSKEDLVSSDWVLLQNPEMLDRYFLSDEDFVAILNQFPNTFAFQQLFCCTADVKKCFSRALTLVLEFTHSLQAFQEFEKLPARIAQLLGQLLSDAAELPGSGRLKDCRMKDAVFYPTLFDQLFLTSLHGLMAADCNRVAWMSLYLYPFDSLSELAKWDVLALLLFNLESLPEEAKTGSGWMQFIGRTDCHGIDTGVQARQHLYELIETDTVSAMYLLDAVASLAASCQSGSLGSRGRSSERNDLVFVAVHELFIAGYTVERCQGALGENGERAAGPLSTICLAHPWVLSLLITLLFKYHQCAETWVHVFETFPINRWMPTAQDLSNLQEWLLLEDTAAPRSVLARFLLDHINWEYDAKSQRLFTDAMLHRQVALMVAEALVLYKTRNECPSNLESSIASEKGPPQNMEVTSLAKSIRRALWLGETVDFEKWCWKLMLKLRFYSPTTQEPLLALIDLRHDRSRAAMTLRRWFAGASTLRTLPFRKAFPFYASFEEQVSHYGFAGSDCRSTVETEVGERTGAPIQESRKVLTPHNFTGTCGVNSDPTISATAAPRTEPIVAYVICQMTTFVFSDRLDRWEPLLVLLKSDYYPAAIKVLENLFPVLARLEKTKSALSVSSTPSIVETVDGPNAFPAKSEKDEAGNADINEPHQSGSEALNCDNELEVCMAAMEALSIDELLTLLSSMHEFSYINTDELHRMQEVLNKGCIGGWENTAKERILAKLRFVRECSRYLHPVVLPALINECFPQSSPLSITTTAIFHGAMSWISSALGGEDSTGALSPSASSSSSAALSIRNSSLIATTASLALVSSSDYSTSTKLLCTFIRRSFEYYENGLLLAESMQFWAKALVHVPFWYENAAFRHILDVMLHCGMESHFHESSSKEDAAGKSASIDASSEILYQLVELIDFAFDAFCRRVARREDDAGQQPEQQFFENEPIVNLSFLPAASASTTYTFLFGGGFDASQYVSGCPYLALWSLLIETRKEAPLFLLMGQLMIRYEPKTMNKLEKLTKRKGRLATALRAVRDGKNLDEVAEEMIYETSMPASCFSNPFTFGHMNFDSLSQYKIFRWCNYCLELPESEPTQIIYWQVFFALYFANAGGSRLFAHHFLNCTGKCDLKHAHLRKRLQTKLQKLVNYFSNQAQVVLTATSGSGSLLFDGVTSTTNVKERRYAHLVALSQLYTAMDAWLEERDPNQWLKEEELSGLPRHYEVDRLKDVLRLSNSLLNAPLNKMKWRKLPLWTSWCGFEFTATRMTSKQRTDTNEDDSASSLITSRAPHLPASVGEVDDFAFVEEASMLRRRRSSFGGVAGPNSFSTKPLPLVLRPTSLTSLPMVSTVITPDRCAITPSIPLNKAALEVMAMKCSKKLSVLVALDSELVDNVSQLYVSKTRTVTQSLPCPEGTNCRGPAAFRFEFVEWMLDVRADAAIQSIRAQGERCDMSSMLVKNVISSISEHGGQMHDEGSISMITVTPVTAEQFLELDEDGLMLSLQILLIDQIVQMLCMERERLQRLKQKCQDDTRMYTIRTDTAMKSIDKESVIAADNIVKDELLLPIQKIDQEANQLHEKGLEWFRLLAKLDTKLFRMVPPLREALWRAIKQLGQDFVCVDERETCTLLQLMLEDPSRINLLSECFFPAIAPSHFVEMFASLMSASHSSKLSTEEKLIVLRRFDFRAWLEVPMLATKLSRDTIICMILSEINNYFPADRKLSSSAQKSKDVSACNHLDDVLRVYANVLQLICSAHLEDHFEIVVHALVAVRDDYRFQTTSMGNRFSTSSADGGDDSDTTGLPALPCPVDALVWEALVGIPLASWKGLPLTQIEACVRFLSQHMASLRWQVGLSTNNAISTASIGEVSRAKESLSEPFFSSRRYPIVYWQRLGVLKNLLDLFTLCCRVAPEEQQWEIITTFFEPLLSTLYQPSTNLEISAICAPWPDQDTISTGTIVCSCFVATCSEYLKTQSAVRPSRDAYQLSLTAKLSQIWSFYLTILVPHAPTHMCKHFHQFVTRLAWEHWCLTLEIMQQMRELIQMEKHQLTRVPIASTDQKVLSLHSTLSPYPFVSWLVRDILCRTTWDSTNAWLDAQSEAVCSSFLLEFAKLCLELVLDVPHFHIQSSHAMSSNVLPPYFVNFIKQQPVFWTKWKMVVEDLRTLQQFTLDAYMEPLGSRTNTGSVTSMVPNGLFPAMTSAAVMQDALVRLQLAQRLFGQITTLHHDKLSSTESLQRVNLFLTLIFGVFEVNDRGFLDGTRYESEHAAWLMVLYGSSCTALYEKLDEIVQFYKAKAGKEIGTEASSGLSQTKDDISEECLTATISGVLRFCNLSLVEMFFKEMQSSPKSGSGGDGSSVTSSTGSNWNKCGNVVFVEVDALVRDFASCQKVLQERSYRGRQSVDCSLSIKEERASTTNVSAIQSPAEAVGASLGKILWSFLAFRGGELACLAACGRALASVHVMSQVAEKSIEKWIIEERRGMWDELALRLHVPELSSDEFEEACLKQGNLLTLHILFLHQLRRAPMLTESLSLALLTKLMGWIERARVGNGVLAQIKLLFMAADVTSFVCKPLAHGLLPTVKKQMLRQLCNVLLEFGHARRNNGIMKAIGLGGSLQYSIEFHVSCMMAGVFLRLQTRNGAPLRVDDRIRFKMTRTTEKHLRLLESMLQSKDAFQLGRRADALMEFSQDPRRSLADQDEFFITLFSSMYPAHGWLLTKCLP